MLVDADIGLGHLDIRKTDPRDDFWEDADHWDEQGWQRAQREQRGTNTGCAP